MEWSSGIVLVYILYDCVIETILLPKVDDPFQRVQCAVTLTTTFLVTFKGVATGGAQ